VKNITSEKSRRPVGVTIIAVLEILAALVMLSVGGLALVSGETASALRLGLVPGLIAVLGAIMLILGIIMLGVAWGLWTGRGWAWTLAVVFVILGVVVGIAHVIAGGYHGILTLILQIVIVYYLFRPNVRAYFGK
jgi:lysylphosphatidylglycerol synthetase-like protein (DUF2156 family)